MSCFAILKNGIKIDVSNDYKSLDDHIFNTYQEYFVPENFEKTPTIISSPTLFDAYDKNNLDGLIAKDKEGNEGVVRIYKNGSVNFRVNGKPTKMLGKIDDIFADTFEDHGLTPVTIVPKGNSTFKIGEEIYISRYSDPTDAINRDAEGNIISVDLEKVVTIGGYGGIETTTKYTPSTITGIQAERIALDLHLEKINKNNENENFEKFLEKEFANEDKQNNGKIQQSAGERPTETPRKVQRREGTQQKEVKRITEEKRQASEQKEKEKFENGTLPKLVKIKSFKTNEGAFEVYDVSANVPHRGDMFTVEKNPDGWIVVDANVPDYMQRRGVATEFYKRMNKASLNQTGKPLQSSSEENEKSKALWESFVKSGDAVQINNGYRFKTKEEFKEKTEKINSEQKTKTQPKSKYQSLSDEGKNKAKDKIISKRVKQINARLNELEKYPSLDEMIKTLEEASGGDWRYAAGLILRKMRFASTVIYDLMGIKYQSERKLTKRGFVYNIVPEDPKDNITKELKAHRAFYIRHDKAKIKTLDKLAEEVVSGLNEAEQEAYRNESHAMEMYNIVAGLLMANDTPLSIVKSMYSDYMKGATAESQQERLRLKMQLEDAQFISDDYVSLIVDGIVEDEFYESWRDDIGFDEEKIVGIINEEKFRNTDEYEKMLLGKADRATVPKNAGEEQIDITHQEQGKNPQVQATEKKTEIPQVKISEEDELDDFINDLISKFSPIDEQKSQKVVPQGKEITNASQITDDTVVANISRQIFPTLKKNGFTLIWHSKESYEAKFGTGTYGVKAGKVIHVRSDARGNTILHEIFHPVISDVIWTDIPLRNKLIADLVNSKNPNIAAARKFAMEYEAKDRIDEGLTEALANTALDAMLEYATKSPNAFTKLIRGFMTKMGLNQKSINTLLSGKDSLESIGRALGEAFAKGIVVKINAKDSKDLKRQIIGERGASNLDKAEEATTRLDNLAIAREMEQAGKDVKSIRLATGWEKGVDGKWRYEVPDSENINSLSSLKRKEIEGREYIIDKLNNLVNDPELFKTYPELNDVDVVLYNFEHPNYISGEFRSKSDYFKMNASITLWNIKYSNDKLPESKVSTLFHEIQHAIQDYEGFAQGGNEGTVSMKDRPDNPKWAEWNSEQNQAKIKEYKSIIETKEYLNERDESNKLFSEEFDPVIDKLNEERTRENNKEISDKVQAVFDEFYKVSAQKFPTLTKADEISKDMIYHEPSKKISGQDIYRRLAGEVESRNVQTRMNMTPEERLNTLLSETEDVAKEDQIFLSENAVVNESSQVKVKTTKEGVLYSSQSDGDYIEDSDNNVKTVSAVWSKFKQIQFYGTTKVKNAEDVAKIMSLLENKSVEHSFIVHIDAKGNSHIQFLGIGGIAGTVIDPTIVSAGVSKFNSKKIYLVHNHPSGNLIASNSDIKVTEQVRNGLEPLDIKVEHIIMDTYKHEYLYIDQYGYNSINKRGENTFTKKIVPDTLSEQNILSKPLGQVRSSNDAFAVIQQLRFGALPKLGMLILSTSNNVIANYMMPEGLDYKKILDYVGEVGIGTGLIFYGNTNNTAQINQLIAPLKKLGISIHDNIILNSNNQDVIGYYESMADTGMLFEVQEKYGTNSIVNKQVDNKVEDWSRDVESTAKALEWVDIEKIVAPKNTKVVDEKGSPLKLYHVSENDIVGDLRVVNNSVLSWHEKRPQSEKDLYQIDENGNYTEIGIHFGGEGTIKDFVERYSISPKTKLSVFLDIKNPIEIRDLAAWTPTNIIKELDKMGYQVGVKKEKYAANEAIDILNRLGIDGFKYENIYEYQGEKYSYMAINPNQIVIIDKNKISEAYHKAKVDGSNPELVKAVEDLLGKPTEQPKTETPQKPAGSKESGYKFQREQGERQKMLDYVKEKVKGKSEEFIKQATQRIKDKYGYDFTNELLGTPQEIPSQDDFRLTGEDFGEITNKYLQRLIHPDNDAPMGVVEYIKSQSSRQRKSLTKENMVYMSNKIVDNVISRQDIKNAFGMLKFTLGQSFLGDGINGWEFMALRLLGKRAETLGETKLAGEIELYLSNVAKTSGTLIWSLRVFEDQDTHVHLVTSKLLADRNDVFNKKNEITGKTNLEEIREIIENIKPSEQSMEEFAKALKTALDNNIDISISENKKITKTKVKAQKAYGNYKRLLRESRGNLGMLGNPKLFEAAVELMKYAYYSTRGTVEDAIARYNKEAVKDNLNINAEDVLNSVQFIAFKNEYDKELQDEKIKAVTRLANRILNPEERVTRAESKLAAALKKAKQKRTPGKTSKSIHDDIINNEISIQELLEAKEIVADSLELEGAEKMKVLNEIDSVIENITGKSIGKAKLRAAIVSGAKDLNTTIAKLAEDRLKSNDVKKSLLEDIIETTGLSEEAANKYLHIYNKVFDEILGAEIEKKAKAELNKLYANDVNVAESKIDELQAKADDLMSKSMKTDKELALLAQLNQDIKNLKKLLKDAKKKAKKTLAKENKRLQTEADKKNRKIKGILGKTPTVTRLINIVKDGVLSDDTLANELSEWYGLVPLTDDEKSQLKKLMLDYETQKREFDKNKAMLTLLNYIDSIAEKASLPERFIAIFQEYAYANMLNSPNSTLDAFGGNLVVFLTKHISQDVIIALKDTLLGYLVPKRFKELRKTIIGDPKSMGIWLDAMQDGLNGFIMSFQALKEVIATGESSHVIFDTDARRLRAEKYGSKWVTKNLKRAIDLLKSSNKSDQIKGLGLSVIFGGLAAIYITSRGLIAADIASKSFIIPYLRNRNAYYALLKAGYNGNSVELLKNINELVGKNSSLNNAIEEDAAESGLIGKELEDFKRRRYYELIPEFAAKEINESSSKMAEEMAMQGEVYGGIGKIINPLIRIKANAMRSHSVMRQIGAIGLTILFPFARVAGIGFNILKSATLFNLLQAPRNEKGEFSLSHGLFGFLPAQLRTEQRIWSSPGVLKETRELTDHEKMSNTLYAIMPTVIAGSLLGMLLASNADDDDDEMTFKIRNSEYRFTGGQIPYGKQQTLNGYDPYAIQKRKGDTWITLYKYENNPMGIMFAPIGALSDEILTNPEMDDNVSLWDMLPMMMVGAGEFIADYGWASSYNTLKDLIVGVYNILYGEKTKDNYQLARAKKNVSRMLIPGGALGGYLEKLAVRSGAKTAKEANGEKFMGVNVDPMIDPLSGSIYFSWLFNKERFDAYGQPYVPDINNELILDAAINANPFYPQKDKRPEYVKELQRFERANAIRLNYPKIANYRKIEIIDADGNKIGEKTIWVVENLPLESQSNITRETALNVKKISELNINVLKAAENAYQMKAIQEAIMEQAISHAWSEEFLDNVKSNPLWDFPKYQYFKPTQILGLMVNTADQGYDDSIEQGYYDSDAIMDILRDNNLKYENGKLIKKEWKKE